MYKSSLVATVKETKRITVILLWKLENLFFQEKHYYYVEQVNLTNNFILLDATKTIKSCIKSCRSHVHRKRTKVVAGR